MLIRNQEIEDELYDIFRPDSLEMTGSYIVDPANAKDIDFIGDLGFGPKDNPWWLKLWKIKNAGWKQTNDERYPDNKWIKATFRKGDYNLIVPADEYQFVSWQMATDVLRNLPHLFLKKEDRVALFETIRYRREKI